MRWLISKFLPVWLGAERKLWILNFAPALRCGALDVVVLAKDCFALAGTRFP